MTLLSRVAGFTRDVVVAQCFGASILVDAFLVANKIPNFMRRLFAEGAFSQAFVPVLSQYRQQKDAGEIQSFLNHVAGVMSLVLLAVTIIGVLAAPLIVLIFAPGFFHDPERFQLTSHMFRFTFPYLLFISLTALSGAILNSYDRFGVPAFTPVLLNVSLILAACFLAPYCTQPIIALAIGVFIAGIVQLLFQFPFLWSIKRFPIPKWSLKDPGVRRVMKLMVPALFGVSVSQINLMIDQWFASFLQGGSISWLYYSDRITQLPLGIFGVAIATVILPKLSRLYAGEDRGQYTQTLDWGIRKILFVGLPSMLYILLLAGPILTTLFQYGAFSSMDVHKARASLLAFGLGLPAFMLIKVFASAFYARQNIRLPVRVGVVAMIANTLFSFCLIWSLHHVGLALATSLSAILNAGLLYYYLLRQGYYQCQPGWLGYGARLLFALAVMFGVIRVLTPQLSEWLQATWQWRAWHMFLCVVLPGLAYLLVFKLGGR